MTTVEYWAELQFDYVTTYSFLRGPKWSQLQTAMRDEIKASRRLLLTETGEKLLQIRRRLDLLHQKNNLDCGLLTENGEAYHITATPIAILHHQTTEVRRLADVLQLPFVERDYWMCGPTFRDALAFYNSRDQLLGVLNICFGCDQIQNDNGVEIKADVAVYSALRQWFLELGHQIESSYVIE